MSDQRIDELFTARPDDFVGRRDELVRTLKGEQRPEDAKQVAALRRPTLAAWAVNQAVRSRPQEFTSLRKAGEELRRLMRRAVSGSGSADVRGATRRRRELIRALSDAAVALLDASGADGAAHRDEIAATFDAASADPDTGERVAAARLTRPEAAPSGFGDLAPLAVMDSAPAEPSPPEPTEELRDVESAADAERRAELRTAVEEARHRAREASTEALRMEEEAEDARRAASAADEEAVRARRAAEAAARQADHRRREAQRRTGEAGEARRVADRRGRELREAERQLEDATRGTEG